MANTTIYCVCEYDWQEEDDHYVQPDAEPYEVRKAYLRLGEAEKDRDRRHLEDLIERLEEGDLKKWDKEGLLALTSMSRERFEAELEEVNLEYDDVEDDVIWPEGHELTDQQKAALVMIFDQITFYTLVETILVH